MEADDDSDGAASDGRSSMHNSSSQTSLIRQKLSADDNGNSNSCSWCFFPFCHRATLVPVFGNQDVLITVLVHLFLK